MKLYRLTPTEATPMIGDKIIVNCGKHGTHTATCHKTGETSLFVFDDYVFLSDRMSAESKLQDLFGEIEEDVREEMIGVPRLMTYGEIFGHDEWYEHFEEDDDDQLELMKDSHMRAASYNGEPEWGWLKNRSVASASNFAVVYDGGHANHNYASGANGVRPAFEISNH